MKFSLTIVGILLAGSTASAQCYSSYQSYAPSYYYPPKVVVKEVVKEVPVAAYYPLAVLVPAISVGYSAPAIAVPGTVQTVATTTQTTAAQAQATTTQTTAIQAAQQAQFSASNGVSIAAASALSDQQVDALLQRFEQRMIAREQQARQQQGQQQPQAQQQPTPEPVPQPQADPVISVLQGKCASCHTGPSSKGNLQIFSAPGQLNQLDRNTRALMALMSRTGKMPPSAKGDPKSPSALTDQECSILDAWASQK